MPVGSGSEIGKTDVETGRNEAATMVSDEAISTTPPTKRAKVAKERGLFQIIQILSQIRT
jgi:hypothetical protein